MSIQLIRFLDRWLGNALILILALLSLLARPFRSHRGVVKDIRHIVLAKYFGIGSIVLATPLLRAIRQAHPEARITFVTLANHAALLEMTTLVDDIVTVRRTGLRPILWDTLRVAWMLRRRGVDIYFDLEFFSRYSAVAAFLSGARNRVGYHSPLTPRARLLTHRVKYNPHRHITQVFLGLGEPLGLDMENTTLERLLPPAEAAAKVQRLLEEHEVEYFIVCHASAGDVAAEYKKWDPKKWAALVDRLLQERRCQHVIFGGTREDFQEVQGILDHVRRRGQVLNWAGYLSLPEYVSLLNRTQLLVTVDSGPQHLAAAQDTPTVTMYGPESPSHYGHSGPSHRIAYLGVYCSPCLNILEGKQVECWYDNRCMRDMEVQAVYGEVIDLHEEVGLKGVR